MINANDISIGHVPSHGFYICTPDRDPDLENESWLYLHKNLTWHPDMVGPSNELQYLSTRAEAEELIERWVNNTSLPPKMELETQTDPLTEIQKRLDALETMASYDRTQLLTENIRLRAEVESLRNKNAELLRETATKTIDKLKAALEPFARYGRIVSPTDPDHEVFSYHDNGEWRTVHLGYFIRAKEVLEQCH